MRNHKQQQASIFLSQFFANQHSCQDQLETLGKTLQNTYLKASETYPGGLGGQNSGEKSSSIM